MILDPALGDVVEEHRDIEHGAVLRLDGAHQLAGKRQRGILAALDGGEFADAADQMLVHRIVVVHVELHHRHDAAERVHEFAEHAGFVHPPQHGFGVVLRGQDFQKQAVGLGIVTHAFVDQLERTRGDPHGLGMKREIVLLREVEQPDQVDRIAGEDVGAGNVDAVVVDNEIVGFRERAPALRRTQPGDEAAEHGRRLGLTLFQAGAQDRGQIADVLGGEEIVLHEALDVLHAGVLGVAEPDRDLALGVE